MSAIPTDRTGCVCGAKVIRTGRLVLDAKPSPFGTYAAYRSGSGGWVTRVLRQGDQPLSFEKRYAVHECGEGG